jgi:hypothetical protein
VVLDNLVECSFQMVADGHGANTNAASSSGAVATGRLEILIRKLRQYGGKCAPAIGQPDWHQSLSIASRTFAAI